MKNGIYVIAFCLIFFNSCKNKSEKLAEDLCDCLKETGMKKGIPSFTFMNDLEEVECFNDIMTELYTSLKDLNNKQRATFMKDYFKALLNTECAEVAFDYIPYDKMLEQMEKEFKRKHSSDSNFFSNEPSVCDCVEMDVNANGELRNKCKKMEEEWKERYENGDEDDQKEMIKEIEDCERLKHSQK